MRVDKFLNVVNITKRRAVSEDMCKSGVVLLSGDLASGKTTLVKAIIKAHGIEESVTSPTFSLMQIYGKDIYH